MSRVYSILDDGHMYKRRRATRPTSPVIALIVNRQHPQLSQFYNSSHQFFCKFQIKQFWFPFGVQRNEDDPRLDWLLHLSVILWNNFWIWRQNNYFWKFQIDLEKTKDLVTPTVSCSPKPRPSCIHTHSTLFHTTWVGGENGRCVCVSFRCIMGGGAMRCVRESRAGAAAAQSNPPFHIYLFCVCVRAALICS
jgi:hypothetical protein